jgi:thymidylate synthase ThyX
MAMDIRIGSISQDSTRYSDESAKKKRLKTKSRQDEEAWSERSDYEEIEDCYTPSEKRDEE